MHGMRTIGNLDERLTSLESMVHAAYSKRYKMILTALIVEVNALKGNKEYEVASNKFDMDAKPAEIPNAPPVG